MKILIAVKQVVDHNVKIRIPANSNEIDLSNLKLSINPFDEVAVEAALRLREEGQAGEIVVVTIGPARASDVLRTALAMGADRAIHIKTDANPEPLGVAKLLQAVALEENPTLLLLGKQAIDDDANQTAQMLSALLGYPQATNVSDIALLDGQLRLTREIDSGLQEITMPIPAVLSVDLRLNEPRYASLPNIMKAKKKPLAEREVSEFGLDLRPRLKVLKTAEPPERAAGILVKDTAELVTRLRNEASVI